jgi:hypothetical protein
VSNVLTEPHDGEFFARDVRTRPIYWRLTMKHIRLVFAVTAVLQTICMTSAIAQAGGPSQLPSKVLLRQAIPTGEITMEQFGEHTVIVSERSSSMDTPFTRLEHAAALANIKLCAAHVFAYVSKASVPDVLFANCPDRAKALSELDTLKANAKSFSIWDGDVRLRPGFCNNQGNDAEQFRTLECNSAFLKMLTDPFFDDEDLFWCANKLRTSSLRIMSEGEGSESRTVSCHGNTRFRLYMRDGSGDSWTKYRDHWLNANEFEITYVSSWHNYSDIDTKYVIESQNGAWHRNTGYFLDD